MKVTLPIYAEERRPEGSAAPEYCARPLFFQAPEATDADLNRALRKLAGKLTHFLRDLGREMRHEAFARHTFCPDLHEHRLDLAIQLRKRACKCRFLFVSFRALGTTLALTPALPDLWFAVDKGQTLADRATEVLTGHFREAERELGEEGAKPEDLAVQGKTLVTTLDLDVYPAQVVPRPEEQRFVLLGQREPVSGAVELDRVGECLDWLYPDDLERAILRDAEVAELARLLADDSDKRPILLLGPRGAGKTTVLHEHVFRSVQKRGRPFASKKNTWLLSPQRLISGMSFVGQWENRLLAILEEARKRSHVLYFDDVLGLYRAGISSESRLCVAHVLKPVVERREVRIVAEMTHEEFGVFQEVDRGFADLFHVVRVDEPTEADTLRILVRVMRRLEGEHRCRFALDVLPTAIDLQRRYVHDTAFPGKAAAFVARLAAKHRGAEVAREAVLREFQAASGLSISFADTDQKLARHDVTRALQEEVIGQDGAVETMATAVCTAKARLNDPARPLATLLFLGPTGVGKTQCAKALAAYLFGSADRLVRFDMNEYVAPDSVPRLAGTFEEPEGLLTRAVRRQPFAVVLLDEIEKAHHSVFDLLLQVLGEGRLTDALGRTADFTNAILILTSNLGVRQAGAGAGFRGPEPPDGSVFGDAAERFFRPEFFNRLDHVVQFHALRREHVARIARLLLRGLFAREGFSRRKLIVEVHPAAMERVVDEGYHPLLGARALKRAIERQLTHPLAAQLAPLTAGTPVVVRVYPSTPGIAAHLHGLVNAEPVELPIAAVDLSDSESALARASAALDRIDAELRSLGPREAFDLGELLPAHHRYFALRDHLQGVRRLWLAVAERRKRRRPASVAGTGPRRRGRLRRLYRLGVVSERKIWEGILADLEARDYLADLGAGRDAGDGGWEADPADDLRHLLLQTTLLHTVVKASLADRHERALVYLRAVGDQGQDQVRGLRHLLASLFVWLFLDVQTADDLAMTVEPGESVLVLEGADAVPFARFEEGTHLFCPLHGSAVPIQATALPLSPGENPVTALRQQAAERQKWTALLSEGKASTADDPCPLGPVIRVYDERGATLDVRTGLLSHAPTSRVDLRDALLLQLPLPPELVR